ncbi:HAD family hydrolase [Acaryochloris sp. IP29b_bin.137]|uniref:HAD family hydrolase n=1 Tax=Acaryochloris sp. IP29b_bin.137 TaxID=2969217 RepID=UPI002617A5E1|nr:HAD family hydrolase [Acaryochloris sp. IP29b_bin.137]
MSTVVAFDWIFFDCFNTLIDDFDQTGAELALLPVYSLPAEAGLYASATDFRLDYHHWRNRQWQTVHREIEMGERYQAVLRENCPTVPLMEIESLAAEMVERFRTCYQQSLRLPPDVKEMLQFWQGRVKMGVVSNFYLRGWPKDLLASFDLHVYFDFVLDSAACGWRKPGEQIYNIACEMAQIAPNDRYKILFVGDHLLNDVLAPQRMGMQGLYFNRSQERPTSAPPTAQVKSFTTWSQFRPEFCQSQLLVP